MGGVLRGGAAGVDHLVLRRCRGQRRGQQHAEGGEGVVERLGDEGMGGHDAVAAVVVRLPLVLLRVERVLGLEGLAQGLVGLGERNRLDPGHQPSSRGCLAGRTARRGATRKRYTGTPAPTTAVPTAPRGGVPAAGSARNVRNTDTK